MKKKCRDLKYVFGDDALLRPIVIKFIERGGQRRRDRVDEYVLMGMAKAIFREIDGYREDWLCGRNSSGSEQNSMKDYPRRYCDELKAEIGQLSRDVDTMPKTGLRYGKMARLQRLRCDLKIAENEQLIEMRIVPKSKDWMTTQELAVREIRKRAAALPLLRELLGELEALRARVSTGSNAEIEWALEASASQEKACSELLAYWKKLEAQAQGFVSVEDVLSSKDLQPYVRSSPALAAEFAGYAVESLQRLSPAVRVARMMGPEIQERLRSGMKEDVVFVSAWNDYFGREVVETVTSVDSLRRATPASSKTTRPSSGEGRKAELLRKKIASLEKEDARIPMHGGESPDTSGA